jgi:hypothetical protein
MFFTFKNYKESKMKNVTFSTLILFVLTTILSLGFYYSLSDDHGTTAVQKNNINYAPHIMTNQKALLGGWTSGANVLKSRYAGRGVTYTQNDTSWLYFIGGDPDGSGNGIKQVDKYDINTDTWINVDSMSTSLAYFGAARLKDSIYTIGGLVTGYFSSATTIVQMYGIGGNYWTIRTPLPIPIGWAECVGYQDSLIYCIGGMPNGTSNSSDTVFLYNCYTNTWRSATSLPVARLGGGCSLVGDTIVYVGGTSGGWAGTTDKVVYRGVISQANRSIITWTTGLNYAGTGKWRLSCAPWGCRGIILAGGSQSNWDVSTECYVYSPGANTWTLQANLLEATSSSQIGSVLYSSSSDIYKLVAASGFTVQAPYSIPNTQIFTDTLPCTPPPSIIPWCEGFNSSTFPPLNWNIVHTSDTIYWLRNNAVSGYGLGTGSSYYNSWTALPGNPQGLVTMKFTPIYSETWSVTFDYAYAPYPPTPPYWQDSLIIQISSNNGTTWTRLIGYGPYELQTAPGQNTEFIPAAGQWGKKALGLPIGTNKIEFMGVSGFGNDIYLDSICVFPVIGIKHNAGDIPKTYKLSQNYPNPFNPSTTINYDLPKAGNVRLIVYDVLGKETNIIVNEVQKAGSYSITWDGSKFASGIYFYRIESGTFTDVKKMVLVK